MGETIMNHYVILTFFAALLIISYIFGILSHKINIPSVLLLIFVGTLSKSLSTKFGLNITIPLTTLQLVGTLGLILIVLDGSLDLNIKKREMPLILSSVLFSVTMIIILSATMGFAISKYYNVTLFTAIVNAVPLSIVSSAIIIPSVTRLNKASREFLIYSSIFSDIFGVLVFNFLVLFSTTTYVHVIGFFASFVLTLALSILFSILLTFILSNFKQGNEAVFILAAVILLYSTGKLFHLSSLVLVFIFGLMLSNFYAINKKFDLVTGNLDLATKVLNEFRVVTNQFSFIIRTLFFFIFGFSIEIKSFWNNNVLFIGVIALFLIYILRYILLKNLFQNSTLEQVFIAPRGLITILLFYTIPLKYTIQAFNQGNLLFLIILTNIVMIFGLILGGKKSVIH
jgi:Kef-type K+ transport system membrane component KefB